ncbi:MAG TPA: cyclodeaminase/cyclohydrolase family protein [Planctomycetota bacterium]|jgi:formiminotetrahydrofolate cyclodeaminase|nr:cyclodeaminase/cyclohydrolase family protein [Planctomycetota bacterium]
MTLGSTSIDAVIGALAERTPVPGGGAAAAIAAALGCAAGAMAARYTSGPKYAAIEAEARNFGDLLAAAALDCTRLGDADAEAYAAVGAGRKTKDAIAIAEAELRAATVPADLLALCAQHAAGLAAFIPTSNPYLVSDVKVGIHLLAGAGRAAWQTLLVNRPDATVLRVAQTHLTALDAAEQRALEPRA